MRENRIFEDESNCQKLYKKQKIYAKRFGESMGILAGDASFYLAFEPLFSSSKFSYQIKIQLVRI